MPARPGIGSIQYDKYVDFNNDGVKDPPDDQESIKDFAILIKNV